MNITVNGIELPIIGLTSISEIIEKFFQSEGEYIVKLNSQTVQTNKLKIIYLCDRDELQIVSFSKEIKYAKIKSNRK